jgi:hypothetical protein
VLKVRVNVVISVLILTAKAHAVTRVMALTEAAEVHVAIWVHARAAKVPAVTQMSALAEAARLPGRL